MTDTGNATPASTTPGDRFMESSRTDIDDDDVRAVHRAAYMAEAMGHRGHTEKQAATAYDRRQKWMNETEARSLREDRREALRENESELAYTRWHIEQAITLGVVAPKPPAIVVKMLEASLNRHGWTVDEYHEAEEWLARSRPGMTDAQVDALLDEVNAS